MLSIIIVSYNTRELLGQCLKSLAIHCTQAQVIVVDNASHDGSPEMVRDEHPTTKLIALEKNVGFAGANNVGLQHAAGKFLLLLNSDTYVEDDSLTRCVAWMEAHPNVGAVSPRLIGFNGQLQPCVHPFPCFWDKLLQTFWLTPSKASGDTESPTGWLIGAALMLRRVAYEQAGNSLDATYFMYWEDTDLCSRLLREGWSLAVYQEGHVRHQGGGSSTDKEGGQRPELHACFLSGKYRWYARYRPSWESAGIWLLDVLDMIRRGLRGILIPHKRTECRRAQTLAWTLGKILLRRTAPALNNR